MFQFRRFPSYTYFIQCRMTGYCPAGFPHSDIPGSLDICSSPRLFAACRVLLRLSVPRHSPCALSSLTNRKRSILSLVLYCELCRQSQIFEIVIVTLHLSRCCSTIKYLTLSMLAHGNLSVALLHFQYTLFSFQGADRRFRGSSSLF